MKYCSLFQVMPGGKKVNLSALDPDDTRAQPDKESAMRCLKKNLSRLAELQYLLYAENRRSVLVVLQAMDAGGKDSVIRNVFGPLNPQGCHVIAFKTPTHVELAHDFLWRVHKETPGTGEIRIFNRSHYEDVLIVRVHNLVDRAVWSRRYDQINAFERLLTQHNTLIIKFFLHISKAEQLDRLQARQQDPTKYWKFSEQDYAERRHWSDYMAAYEAALGQCSTPYVPWYIIPANKKWFRNLAVSEILVETLSRLKMKFPKHPALSKSVTGD